MIKHLIWCLLFLIIVRSEILPQASDNLTSFNLLVDSLVNVINQQINPAERISIKTSMPDSYFSFRGRIISGFRTRGKEVLTDNIDSGYIVNISIENAKIIYSDLFKEKLFGDFKVKRVISLTGNYNIIHDGIVSISDEINYQKSDTVDYNDIKSLENNSHPFTKGEIPSEPFFSSLIEPVIAISAAALTVILFFTVRSK